MALQRTMQQFYDFDQIIRSFAIMFHLLVMMLNKALQFFDLLIPLQDLKIEMHERDVNISAFIADTCKYII